MYPTNPTNYNMIITASAGRKIVWYARTCKWIVVKQCHRILPVTIFGADHYQLFLILLLAALNSRMSIEATLYCIWSIIRTTKTLENRIRSVGSLLRSPKPSRVQQTTPLALYTVPVLKFVHSQTRKRRLVDRRSPLLSEKIKSSKTCKCPRLLHFLALLLARSEGTVVATSASMQRQVSLSSSRITHLTMVKQTLTNSASSTTRETEPSDTLVHRLFEIREGTF